MAKIRQEKWDRFFWFCPCSGKETIKHEILKHTDLSLNDLCIFDDKTRVKEGGL